MESEKLLCIVTEYLPNGELYGKWCVFIVAPSPYYSRGYSFPPDRLVSILLYRAVALAAFVSSIFALFLCLCSYSFLAISMPSINAFRSCSYQWGAYSLHKFLYIALRYTIEVNVILIMLPISNPIFHVVNTQTFSISHAFCTNREFCDVCCSAIHLLCPRNSSAKSPPHWTTILGGEKLSWTEQEIAFTSICDTNS